MIAHRLAEHVGTAANGLAGSRQADAGYVPQAEFAAWLAQRAAVQYPGSGVSADPAENATGQARPWETHGGHAGGARMTDRRTAAAAATAAARTVLTHARNTLLSSVAAVRGAGQAVTEREIPAKVSTAAHTWTAANWTKIRSTTAAAPRTWPAASRNKILAAAGLVACALITMVVTAGDGGTLAAAASGPAAAPGTGPIKADPGGTRPPAPAGPADSGTTTGGAPDPATARRRRPRVRTGVRYQLLFAAAAAAGLRPASAVRAGAGRAGPHDRRGGRLRIPHHPS